MRRVVVTGLGLVTPLADGVAETFLCDVYMYPANTEDVSCRTVTPITIAVIKNAKRPAEIRSMKLESARPAPLSEPHSGHRCPGGK